MTIAERYLRYLEELESGARPLPEGLFLEKENPMERAAELQMQIQAMGLGQFLSLCAAQDGEVLSDAETNISPEDLMQHLRKCKCIQATTCNYTIRRYQKHSRSLKDSIFTLKI